MSPVIASLYGVVVWSVKVAHSRGTNTFVTNEVIKVRAQTRDDMTFTFIND